MANEPTIPPPADTTLTADDDLPRTLPIRVLTNVAVPDSTDPPEKEEPTRNIRVSSPQEPPTTPRPRRPLSSGLITMQAWRRPSQRGVEVPAGARLRLRVLRGQRVNVEYPLYDGANYMGRRDDEPIDIDLTEQEPNDRIWA